MAKRSSFEAEVDGHKIYMDTLRSMAEKYGSATQTPDDGCSGRLYRYGCGFHIEENEGRTVEELNRGGGRRYY